MVNPNQMWNPLPRGKTYLGRKVPDEYFEVQDYLLYLQKHGYPKAMSIAQGVENVAQAVEKSMPYLLRVDIYGEEGALSTLPGLADKLREQLVRLTYGREVLRELGLLK